MSTHAHEPIHAAPKASFFTYASGFLFSILLTLGAFWLAPSLGTYAVPAIVATALVQLFIQLVFFLHLGRDRERSSDLGLFMLTFVIICILVGGTLWIMTNLARLHVHAPTTDDLYQGGVVSPATELK